MHEKIEKVRNHLKENKRTYGLCAATAMISAGSTLLVLGRPNANAQVVQQVRQIAWRADCNAMIINLTEKSTPSKPVHLVGTNLYFDSISDAARKTGHNIGDISRVVNGLRKDVHGDVFELLQPA